MSSTVLDAPSVTAEWWQTEEYLEVVYAVAPHDDALHVGSVEPRKATSPLRPLTRATSLGFEVIEYAEIILGVVLYPWQRALLIRALELMPNGKYRFRRVIVLVARQQGKTTLASVLAAWWLFVDSARRPDRVPPMKFKVVGVAQTLDIAKEPWSVVKLWCDPDPETDEEGDLAIESLQDATAAVRDANGELRITARSRAHYEIRAAKNARGKPAARVLMDELREQRDWLGWNAVSQTMKSFWNGMLVGFSNAGDPTAIVLKKQRDAGLADIAAFEAYVAAGIRHIEDYLDYADGRDVSLALFEWSAPDGCEKDDVDGILAANPSIGYGEMTVADAIADIRSMTDAGYRTEVLCQWVAVRVDSYIDIKEFRTMYRPADEVAALIPAGARTVWAVDIADRSMTWIGAAVRTSTGKPFTQVHTMRAGMVWAIRYLADLAAESGHREVVVQERGCPATELIAELEKVTFLDKAGKPQHLIVHKIDGGKFAAATGQMHDAVRDRRLVLVKQDPVDLAVQGGLVMDYAQNKAWNRPKSLPVDIAGLVAMSEALYGLENLTPPPPPVTPPPPPAPRILSREVLDRRDIDPATVRF